MASRLGRFYGDVATPLFEACAGLFDQAAFTNVAFASLRCGVGFGDLEGGGVGVHLGDCRGGVGVLSLA